MLLRALGCAAAAAAWLSVLYLECTNKRLTLKLGCELLFVWVKRLGGCDGWSSAPVRRVATGREHAEEMLHRIRNLVLLLPA